MGPARGQGCGGRLSWSPNSCSRGFLTLSSKHFVIFSGGMPRASYGDRHCVSVLQAETLVTLDFTSRVIDFFTVHSTRPEDGVFPPCPHRPLTWPPCVSGCTHPPRPTEFDEPQALAVLLEEELVVLDLQTPGWPAVPAPYLAPLHSSAITCSAHVANVPAKLWARILSAGEQQSPQPASGASVCARGGGGGPPGVHYRLRPRRGRGRCGWDTCKAFASCTWRLAWLLLTPLSIPQSWPITGGRNLAQEPSQRGLLLTG